MIGAGLVALFGAIVLLIALFGGKTSPRGYIAKHYKKVSAGTYSSPKAPLAVAEDIVDRNGTKDRVYTPTGVFLRYHNAVVGILPEGRGSKITLDAPARGYARYHSYVGGSWGGSGGRATSFRGGGPGEGK
ncbi:DUF4247 domain-containing protein [Spirillospora sp. NPDC029432]|uniref:DUF4247 domain-containing protein n=1 Tax=Spirillospora sp. NPDC029432 TaxID=3154599 RepID=UPI003451B676